MKSRVLLRKAQKTDLKVLNDLSINAKMGELSDMDNIIVAETENGIIAGFVRIASVENERYVNPIVVSPTMQRQGVGSILMEQALQENGPLMFVARGEAVPFYKAIGCIEISMDSIASSIKSDCDTCSDYESCKPVAMTFAHETNRGQSSNR